MEAPNEIKKKIENILEIIEDHRRDGAGKLKQSDKPKLRAWRAFLCITALVRIVYFILIAYAAFFIRYELLTYFIEPRGQPEDQRLSMASDLLPLLFVLCVFGVIMDILICVFAFLQIPKYISYLNSNSLFFVFFILSFLFLTANVSADPDETTVQILGRAISTGGNYEMWEELPAGMKCCGFYGAEDLMKKEFAEFKDNFYEANVIIPNNLDWISECSQKTGEIAGRVLPSCRLRDGTYTTGCVAALSDDLKWALSIYNYAAIVLALFTFIMVVLLTTIMIYHDSIGHMSKQNYCKIDPPQTDFMVRFFLELDGFGGVTDLSELSSIEEIIKKELNS